MLQKTLEMSAETGAKVERSHLYRNAIDGDKPRPTNPVRPRGTRHSTQETIQPLPKPALAKGWGAIDGALNKSSPQVWHTGPGNGPRNGLASSMGPVEEPH